MPGDDQWRRSLREAMAERAMRHRRPEPEELIDYVEGRLSPARREEIEEATALDPELARELAELAVFPDVEPTADMAAPSEAEVTASWQRFRPRLEELRRRGTVAPPRLVPEPIPSRRPTARWTLAHAAALFFFLTTAALLVAVVRGSGRPPQPVANVAVAELSPVGEEVRRAAGGGERIALPREAERLVLVLALADAGEHRAYNLTLRTAAGEPLWSTDELRRFDDGTFRLLLPRRLVAGGGRYLVEVEGLDADGPVALARYELVVEVE